MHRTEGADHSNNQFTDGPPGTKLEQNWCNAVQEELAYVIEQAGISLKTASNDTRQQLKAALDALITLVNLGIDASASQINTVAHGSTAKNSHTHVLGDGASDVDASYQEINQRCDGVPSFLQDSNSALTVDSSLTELLTIDLGTVTAGDVFSVTVFANGTKGATAGQNILQVGKSSGAGVIKVGGDPNGSSNVLDSRYYINAAAVYHTFTVFCEVTTGGTLVLGIDAQSLGSDTTSCTIQAFVQFNKKT